VFTYVGVAFCVVSIRVLSSSGAVSTESLAVLVNDVITTVAHCGTPFGGAAHLVHTQRTSTPRRISRQVTITVKTDAGAAPTVHPLIAQVTQQAMLSYRYDFVTDVTMTVFQPYLHDCDLT